MHNGNIEGIVVQDEVYIAFVLNANHGTGGSGILGLHILGGSRLCHNFFLNGFVGSLVGGFLGILYNLLRVILIRQTVELCEQLFTFLLRLGSFRTVFAVCGLAALIMALAWKILYEKQFGSKAVQKVVRSAAAVQAEIPFTGKVFLLMGSIMAGIVLHGALRDGVSNWMPTFVSESFGLDSSSAIYTGVLLPIFAIGSIKAASWLYQKVLPNEVTASGAFFAVGALAALLLTVFMEKSVLSTALLMALLVGCMHGVNFILVSMTPPHFRKHGHVALVSGVLNCSTYVGSAISTYGIALLSEGMGWRGTSILWAMIAGAGALICFVIAGKWQKFKR